MNTRNIFYYAVCGWNLESTACKSDGSIWIYCAHQEGTEEIHVEKELRVQGRSEREGNSETSMSSLCHKHSMITFVKLIKCYFVHKNSMLEKLSVSREIDRQCCLIR